jgi:hypothetical protein
MYRLVLINFSDFEEQVCVCVCVLHRNKQSVSTNYKHSAQHMKLFGED